MPQDGGVIGPYDIPSVQDRHELPFSILQEGVALRTRDERRVLLSLFNSNYREITAFTPERLLLQEAAVSIATQVQISNGDGQKSYDAVIDRTTRTLVENIRARADYPQMMETLREQHAQIEQRMQALTASGKEFDPATANTPEEVALAKAVKDLERARGELEKKGTLADVELLVPEGKTIKDMLVQRATDILYEQTARTEMARYIDPTLHQLMQQEHLQPITYHDPKDAKLAAILGGPASGKGTTVGELESIVTTDRGMNADDRILVNGDAFKPLFATEEHLTTYKHVQSQLLMDEAAIVKTRVLKTVEASATRPNLVLDQVFVGPNDPTLQLVQGDPKHLSIVATDIDVAMQRSFFRGEMTGRYEHKTGVLSIHRNVSRDFADRINSLQGQDIVFDVVDGNKRPPVSIMHGDLKSGHIVITDLEKMALFSGKKNLNINATNAQELFGTETGKPAPNLDLLDELKKTYPSIEIHHQGKPALRLNETGEWHAVDPHAAEALHKTLPDLDKHIRAPHNLDVHPLNVAPAALAVASGITGKVAGDALHDAADNYNTEIGKLQKKTAQAYGLDENHTFSTGEHIAQNAGHAMKGMAVTGVISSLRQYSETNDPSQLLNAGAGTADLALDIVPKLSRIAKLPGIRYVADAVNIGTSYGKGEERVGMGWGSAVGGAAGAVIGQVLIPIPGVGAVVGGFVGGYVGEKIGGPLNMIMSGDDQTREAGWDKLKENAKSLGSYLIPGTGQLRLAGDIVKGTGEIVGAVGEAVDVGGQWVKQKCTEKSAELRKEAAQLGGVKGTFYNASAATLDAVGTVQGHVTHYAGKAFQTVGDGVAKVGETVTSAVKSVENTVMGWFEADKPEPTKAKPAPQKHPQANHAPAQEKSSPVQQYGQLQTTQQILAGIGQQHKEELANFAKLGKQQPDNGSQFVPGVGAKKRQTEIGAHH